ncbi:sugar-binding transcriptional regulator [Longirhabdus pacifica]|uniref:sugar-binding transcriptional regulator n=1 Tax=Longirhabdus pacifica TaxID=2305227 RepID=UPI0010088593|nr:sugar-binding domain-containing protein [Longirhabdus pacifica]
MEKIIQLHKQLIPDLTETLKKRYAILEQVMITGTIGRRNLATSLNMTERSLRSEVDFLKEQDLLSVTSAGMSITEAGKLLVHDLEPTMKELIGLTKIERKIKQAFGMKEVIVVSGDSDTSMNTMQQLGRAGANILKKYAANLDVIAVAGGSTMAEVSSRLSVSTQLKGCLFVPARGGLVEDVELQANSIASTMAKRTGAAYRLLHVPDHLGEEAYQTLMQDPNISDLVQVIRNARMIFHGIGEAITMAKRRKVHEGDLNQIAEKGALAEAFGYYFDKEGNVVHAVTTVGLKLEDVNSKLTIGVAGGSSKGEAITAVLRAGYSDVLITDEGAAMEIVKQCNLH